MHELNFVDESFDLSRATEYQLSIQVGLDGFSFCILDIISRKFIVIQHIPLIVGKIQFLAKKMEAVFELEDKLSASYQSVSVIYSTNKATLIPKAYDGSELVARIAELTNDINRNEEIAVNDLPGFNQQVIFSYPKELMTLLNRKYTEFTFMHKSVPLVAKAVDQRDEKKNTLMINFEKQYIRIIAIKDMQIVLYNSFYFKNESDFLYYTLNICHTLQIDPERDELLIGGYVADDSGYIRQLKKYISNVHFLKPSEDFYYSNTFDKVQKHQFVSLLNSFQCG
ncbi:MAG TPA: hypothetical protein DCL77_04380 [Prolixibacteraceae bacterium]|jgi:hypothetical protein|nr:hypothetical protein [Prolixibacteraceae bacterium]